MKSYPKSHDVLSSLASTSPVLSLFFSFAPIRPGDSDDSHYRRLGYRVDDDSAGGKVEEQPKFVKRMGGLARLYAAAAACALPSRQADAGADHPHGLGHLWSWLASALNLRPVNDVSATLLHDVLEVAGGALGKAYGSAFLKVKKKAANFILPYLISLLSLV